MAVEFEIPSSESSGINLTPLIDIIFQLLIFFLLSSTFLVPSLEMKLPELSNETLAEDENRVVLSVDENRSIFINRTEVTRETLTSTLSEMLSEQASRVVYFRGDRNLPYEDFLELMDLSRKAGASDFNLVHEPVEP